jgi:hypothetical protein
MNLLLPFCPLSVAEKVMPGAGGAKWPGAAAALRRRTTAGQLSGEPPHGDVMRVLIRVTLCAVFTVLAADVRAQDVDARLDAGRRVASLQATPASLSLDAGESAAVQVTALDADGRAVDALIRIVAGRAGLRATPDGRITALAAGNHEVIATVQLPPGSGAPPALRIPVEVRWPAIARVEIGAAHPRLYTGSTVPHQASAFHADDSERPRPTVRWSTSDETVASVDAFGNVTAHRAGQVTITAQVDNARAELSHTVAAFPAARIELTTSSERVRTGDVVALGINARSAAGDIVPDVPASYSFTFLPDDSINAPGAAGLVVDDRFVAEVPGVYTIIASAGPLSARRTIDVRPRDAIREVEFIGHGQVGHVHTSDLWVWEGVNGRDYAITGTWGGDGLAYVWDVTDPSSIVKTDSIKVDARTVNDVKVSPDGRYAVMSREGASNRRNGVIILDLKDPAHPVIASSYDDGLTGGVHNVFATDDHLFALSAGEKYVILDVRDLYNPKYVSEYNHPDSRIHDVWVHDGIAYSSEWGNGVVVVDVGNGRWGGTIDNPVFVTNVPYPVGRTHAAFPYFQQSTGRFYLFLGDEIMTRRGAAWAGTQRDLASPGGVPLNTSGYYHIIDFTDPENPKDVARYEVPEYGTHNLWVEDDVLYTAYYDGGLRVVDVSGELLGNLANQGREIAVFKPYDPAGFISNAPMVWGPQPYKGNIFFSDFNSGIWTVKLRPRPRDVS